MIRGFVLGVITTLAALAYGLRWASRMHPAEPDDTDMRDVPDGSGWAIARRGGIPFASGVSRGPHPPMMNVNIDGPPHEAIGDMSHPYWRRFDSLHRSGPT